MEGTSSSVEQPMCGPVLSSHVRRQVSPAAWCRCRHRALRWGSRVGDRATLHGPGLQGSRGHVHGKHSTWGTTKCFLFLMGKSLKVFNNVFPGRGSYSC